MCIRKSNMAVQDMVKKSLSKFLTEVNFNRIFNRIDFCYFIRKVGIIIYK